MLQRLEIVNFALIENLEISFQAGFTSVTGETGSGKSVMLQALGLLLGNRADSKTLKNPEVKCVVEGEFLTKDYDLKRPSNRVTEQPSGDFWGEVLKEDHLVIRRVILPSGKSRAYVNEEPVKLEDLKILGEQLVDIHSQHQNMLLKDANFAREVVDRFAENSAILSEYQAVYKTFQEAQKRHQELLAQQAQAQSDYEYNQHQLEAFADIPEDLDLSVLESEQEMGAHGVEIEQGVREISIGVEEGEGTLDAILKILGNLESFYVPAKDWRTRIEAAYFELQEIKREVESHQGTVDLDPERVEYVSTLLGKIYGLMKRYNVNDVENLWKIKTDLESKISLVEDFEAVIAESERTCEFASTEVHRIGGTLSDSRMAVMPGLEQQISEQLEFLGMGDAVVKIEKREMSSENGEGIAYGVYGGDQIEFLYAAHPNLPLRPLGQIGSGGEMARVMLVLKNILAQKVALPTIIFDEIDTGVSGEIADRVGQMMQGMAESRQVFGITHLPQVAAKGNHQLKVLKEGDEFSAYTRIVYLADEDRTAEIAQMISGQNITDSALAQARELLR